MSAKGTSIFDFTDFRGGYHTDTPTDLMQSNELTQAENCYWREGLVKRAGKASYTSLTGSSIKGAIRAHLQNVWYTILGVDTTAAGAVEVKMGTGTAFASLTYPSGTAHTLTSNYDVHFCYLDNRIVAVNGIDKPKVIWGSATATWNYYMDDLERYDTRTMDPDSWYAGPYIESSSSYADDTTDAQSSASASLDFILSASTTGTAGFWVACDNTFNKINIYDVSAISTNTCTFTWEYWGRASAGGTTTWQTFTPISTPTWTSVGNKTIEMNFPIDSNTNEILLDKYGDSAYNIAGRYVMRFRNGVTPSVTWGAAYMTVQHSQYLTQICLDDRPDTVATHKNHVFLGMGNWLRHSPYSQVTGWREANKAYFAEGGAIQAMIPHKDYLAILLEDAIHGITGNSFSNFAVRELLKGKGPLNKRSAAVVNELIYFVARDGIYQWDGNTIVNVSKHIRSDLNSYTLTNACGVNNKGEYWVSFPSNTVTLIFDPDTFRLDDRGDGRVSFYKQTYGVNQWIPCFGMGDTGYLLAIVNGASQVRLDQCETGTADLVGTTSTITMQVRTRDEPFGGGLQDKTFRRIKTQLGQVSATAGINYLVKLYGMNRAASSSVSIPVTVQVGTGLNTNLIGVPPDLDGYTLALYVKHDSQYAASFLGYSVEVSKRGY